MVYCGKPSKGCSNCRERKIRCDQREPGCGQCEKRQQSCPGYRNLVDLMFRDESSHVIKKAKAKARKRGHLTIDPSLSPGSERGPSLTPEPPRKSLSLVVPRINRSSSPSDNSVWSCDDDSVLMSPDSGSWPVTPAMALFYNLAPTCQERGFAYFFSRYVSVEETPYHQRFDFIREVWSPSPSSQVPERELDGVLASMTAVGLMGLASLECSKDMMEAAQKSYGTALQLINQALMNPVEVLKDSTMLSVLILGLFEMLADNTEQRRTIEAFQEHVNGAVALAKARGVAQFRTNAGVRMFVMLCQRVIMSCIIKETAMPRELTHLWQEMYKILDPTDPTVWVTPLMAELLQIRHEIKTGEITDPEIIVGRLINIETDFETRLSHLPPSWQYRTFKVDRYHPAIFGGVCHAYPSLRQASMWNMIRLVRILTLETILATIYDESQRYSPRLSSDYYVKEFNRAKRKLMRMVEGICATVPQHQGLIDSTDGTIDGSATTPISSVEVVGTPSPPTSPSSRLSDSGSSSAHSPRDPLDRPRPSGLTLLDITKAKDAEDEASRITLLMSAPSAIVWPLFVVGMSSVCTEDMKTYVVDRLKTICAETSISQADAVANLIDEHETSSEWLDVPLRPHDGVGCALGRVAREHQQHGLFMEDRMSAAYAMLPV